MTNASLVVGEGTRVYLNFALRLEDGAVVDSNFEGDEVSFVVGDGSLLPGFERKLFGMAGGDVNKGADILVSLALDAMHQTHNGEYFDNDRGGYGPPHRDALDPNKCSQVTQVLDE